MTAAVLIMRSEATAEASLARRRERRKLGIAIAEIIKMIDTTISSSIKEKPFCFRISPPEARIRDTRPGDATPRKSPSGGQALLSGLEPELAPNTNREAWFATRDRLNFEGKGVNP